VLKSFLTI